MTVFPEILLASIAGILSQFFSSFEIRVDDVDIKTPKTEKLEKELRALDYKADCYGNLSITLATYGGTLSESELADYNEVCDAIKLCEEKIKSTRVLEQKQHRDAIRESVLCRIDSMIICVMIVVTVAKTFSYAVP